jgi:hypothetical protein
MFEINNNIIELITFPCRGAFLIAKVSILLTPQKAGALQYVGKINLIVKFHKANWYIYKPCTMYQTDIFLYVP